MSNPRSISDLRYQDNVERINKGTSPEAVAEQWFREVFDSNDTVYVRFLFEEGGAKVFEAYTDPGSVDYLYIIQS
jgi:hypothetical protein